MKAWVRGKLWDVRDWLTRNPVTVVLILSVGLLAIVIAR